MQKEQQIIYTEDSIKSLDWREHIRLRPGMYIGKLGDGSAQDDGIYILIKEIMDNAIDEYVMGHGKKVDISLERSRITVRDYGRGIPLGKVVECVSQINTGGKYDSKAFKKSVGLNGVGTKAVNALSAYFRVESIREGQSKIAEFNQGILTQDHALQASSAPNGTIVSFEPDTTIFKHLHFIPEFIENQLWNYAYLNAGLKIYFNNQLFYSQNGLLDLLSRKIDEEQMCYPIIHLRGDDLEVAITHSNNQYGEEYYSFVNGQYTPLGGTHLAAFKEAYVKTVREFYGKNYDTSDIRASIVAAVSIRVEEPVFESQTKTKLGSLNIAPEGVSVRSFVNDFLKEKLDNFLHKNAPIAEALLKRILQSERERKELSDIKQLAKKRAKSANLHNKKLRDCRYHLNEEKNDKRYDSTLFITEGDSASGSITKARNVETQAVFSLRGKPLNCYGMSKKTVYENEEFNLLQHALNIEDGIEGLRYNKVIIATDADVDGMHIRLLTLTFFLQFFPDIVRNGHLYILQTPLFRVRDKNDTHYCYSEAEKQRAIKKLRGKPEITRFKGLGEISPDEFGKFIGENMRAEPVILNQDTTIGHLLKYYMGKNTPERQTFIIDNLRLEEELVEEIAFVEETAEA